MSAPKIGDRVRVTYEGTVARILPSSGRVMVAADGHRTDRYAPHATAWPEHVAVIERPLSVGDVVDAVRAENLPWGSAVLCLTNGLTYVRPLSDVGLWCGGVRMNAPAGGDCRILHVGGRR